MSPAEARILCIDDEPDLLEDLSLELADAGYRVVQARTGMEGLAALVDGGIDLVICDIRMPGLDGMGLLDAARERNREGKVPAFVMLSAFSDPALRDRALGLGASAFVVKPVDYADLLDLVERVLAG